jgi:hypothetical protein
MSAPKWLIALGIPEDCIAQKSSAEERGCRFSIHPRRGEIIWRVRVDGCWLPSGDSKKVDYLFWGQSAAERAVVLLVELKGEDFGKALQQIKSTLEQLCKKADGMGIHTGVHRASPGHAPLAAGGVRAYVVLSKGRGVPQRQQEREYLRKQYGVILVHKERRFEIDGIEAILSG